MDPANGAMTATASTSPGGSRVSLPSLVAQVQASGAGDGIFSALASPPLSPSPVGGASAAAPEAAGGKQVFSDFRRFVSFAVRRERGENAS